MALGINPTYFRGHPRGLGRSWRRTMGSWRRNRPSGIRLREAPDADAPELRGTERSARPRVAARSLMSGASWPATVADASSTSVHVPGRVVVADFAVWTWRAPSRSRFLPLDPVREAGGRTDNACFNTGSSPPPFLALRPRVAAHSPMSVASWRAPKAIIDQRARPAYWRRSAGGVAVLARYDGRRSHKLLELALDQMTPSSPRALIASFHRAAPARCGAARGLKSRCLGWVFAYALPSVGWPPTSRGYRRLIGLSSRRQFAPY